MEDLTKKKVVEIENKEENIKIFKAEKRGIYVVLVMYVISWGMIVTPWGIMRLIGWVAMGLIGFSLWRILEGLFERAVDGGKKK